MRAAHNRISKKELLQSLKFFSLLALLVLTRVSSGHAFEIEAITKPMSDIDISFVQSGKILEIPVREGDQVTEGQLLARQEDEIERIQLTILTGQATNTIPVELAATELTQKKKDLEKMKMARDDGAITAWEFEHAALAVDTALLSLKLAQFEHDQAVLQQKTVEEMLHRLHLYSPIEGVVEEIRVEVGESVQALKPVMRIVNTGTLVIDVPVPLAQSATLEPQQQVKIVFADTTQVDGRVEAIDSVADAAAGTLNVQVRATNSTGRPVGERVKVLFGE